MIPFNLIGTLFTNHYARCICIPRYCMRKSKIKTDMNSNVKKENEINSHIEASITLSPVTL